MKILYKNTNLDVYKNSNKIDFDINKDVDVATLRGCFNKTIGELSLKHDSLEYWLMRLSERNTLVNDLFLDICRIVMLEALSEKHNDLCVYTNNLSIFIYFNTKSEISFKDNFKFNVKKCFSIFKPYLGVLSFLIKKILFTIKYVDRSQMRNLSNFTVIQTWVSDNNFTGKEFKDSYYGDLAAYLKSHKKKVITWPVFYNVYNEKKVVSSLRESSSNYLIIEDYLTMRDYIAAIRHFFVKRFLNLGDIEIDGDSFSSIFKYYQKRESVEYVSLFYQFTKVLKDKGSENITFIQNHENMISEKALILGVKDFLSDSVVIGYFHTTKPENILCLEYASEEEYEISPKPDTVIFNSNKYKKFYENKYKKLTMHNGVAFKQLHLKNSTKPFKNDSLDVLVLFPGTQGLVEKMFGLLNQLKGDYSFLFRMHPLNQFDVKKYYGRNDYQIVNKESFDGLIANANKVISAYSAAVVEAALEGCSIGLLYDKSELLLNPFDSTTVKSYTLISDVDTLEEFLEESHTTDTVEQFFNLDEEYYKIFLDVT